MHGYLPALVGYDFNAFTFFCLYCIIMLIYSPLILFLLLFFPLLTLNVIKSPQVVLLQHGLLDSAATWVVTTESSLGFTLANAGYGDHLYTQIYSQEYTHIARVYW